MIIEDKCCSAVLQILAPEFGMKCDVPCWIAKLKLALNEGSSRNMQFTSMFLIPAIPPVFFLQLSVCIFLCKGLRCINTSVKVYKESSGLSVCG